MGYLVQYMKKLYCKAEYIDFNVSLRAISSRSSCFFWLLAARIVIAIPGGINPLTVSHHDFKYDTKRTRTWLFFFFLLNHSTISRGSLGSYPLERIANSGCSLFPELLSLRYTGISI